jgi:hypothetical protein
VGESAYWHVARRRWQVVVAFAQLGVGTALVASEVFNSTRPLRDIVVGLVVGLAIGLVAVRPAEQLAGPPAPAASGGRHWRRPQSGGRHQVTRRRLPEREIVVFTPTPWPRPELTEQPRPTFARPRR